MKPTSRAILRFYELGLSLYPPELRERYEREMLFCAEQMLLAEDDPWRAAGILVQDLLRSAFKENLSMLKPSLASIVLLLTLTTFVAGTAYVISQQVLRASANDPQIQMAEDGVQRLDAGTDPAKVIPEREVDIASSITPFVIIFDKNGNPVASSGKLDGTTPIPPRGVFDYVKANGEDRVTWMPRGNVRVALVLQRTSTGYIAVARSLRETESRIALIGKLALTSWILVNLVSLSLLFVISHQRRAPGLLPVTG